MSRLASNLSFVVAAVTLLSAEETNARFLAIQPDTGANASVNTSVDPNQTGGGNDVIGSMGATLQGLWAKSKETVTGNQYWQAASEKTSNALKQGTEYAYGKYNDSKHSSAADSAAHYYGKTGEKLGNWSTGAGEKLGNWSAGAGETFGNFKQGAGETFGNVAGKYGAWKDNFKWGDYGMGFMESGEKAEKSESEKSEDETKNAEELLYQGGSKEDVSMQSETTEVKTHAPIMEMPEDIVPPPMQNVVEAPEQIFVEDVAQKAPNTMVELGDSGKGAYVVGESKDAVVGDAKMSDPGEHSDGKTKSKKKSTGSNKKRSKRSKKTTKTSSEE